MTGRVAERLNSHKDQILHLYKTETLDEIAKRYQCCRGTIRRFIERNGGMIKSRGGKNKIWCEQEFARLKSMYTNGMTISEISRRENCSFHNMRKRLIKYGIKQC